MEIEFEEQFVYVRINFAKFLRILGGSGERFNGEDYMRLYTYISNMPHRPYYQINNQDLYDAYKEMITDYVRSTELPPLREKHEESMLTELVERWDEHKLIVRWLSRCFQHLDVAYLIQARHPCLRETGLTIFRDLVFDEMHGKAKDAALNMINKERGGEYIDRSLLRNVSHIFVEIGMPNMERYEQNFEVHLLRVTAYYYALRAADWIVEDSCPDYMIKSEECLRKERERASNYLHASSEPKIVETVQYELLVVYATQLLEKEQSGCHALLRDDKVDDLSRMYRLYHKIPEGLNPVAAIFKQHITTEGTVLVQQAEDAASSQFFFRKLLELHEKSMEYVKGCFQNHELFHKALREAFEILCNKTVAGSSSAEMLATFCDNALKNDGSEKRRDEAISKTWEAIKVIAYISDKDLFAEFYEKKLVRRLLFSRSDNDDHEKSILEELRQYCGRHFTAIMEYTIETMASATENQANFERYLADNPTAQPGIDLSDKVLTSGFWRSFKSSHLSLLAEMVNMIRSCPENCLPGKFTWTHTLGTFRMVGQFDPRPIELIVTPYQAAVLLLFNSSDRLSYSEISTQSNLSQDELVRVLRSLSCNKYKILHKDPSSKTVSQTDHFEFNKKFTDRKTRIMIPLPSEHERKQIVEDVNTKRVPALDAALLRIMKFRNILDRQDLIMECVDQLSHMFKPDTEAIINRIEILISEKYLELDEENPILVRYLPRPFKWW